MTLTEKDVAEVRLRYQRGQSARQLAGRFGVSPDTIERCIPAEQRRPGRFQPRDLPITEAELVRRREAGALWRELAEDTGLSIWGVRNRYLAACRRSESRD